MKIKIFILMLAMYISFNSIDIYASTPYTYESEYRGVIEGGYVKYGHLIISSNTNINVVYCMFDVGWTYRYIPIIYSKESASVSVNVKGNHSSGTTLEHANNLSDYYNTTHNLTSVQLTDLGGNPSYYIYNTWQDSIMEYYTNKFIEFETTDTPKFYYYEENADLKAQDTFIKALNSYLGGGLSDFTISGGTVSKVSNYSLEPPLNVKVNNFNPKKVVLQWEQSEDKNIDGWETEIYIKQKGTYKKTIFSNKKNYDTDWQAQPFTPTYKKKYIFNSLTLETTDKYLIDFIDNNGYQPQVSTVEKTDIMLRNKYIDDNGQIYYSNYVYLYQDSDYKYIANEVDGSELDKNGMSTDNIDKNVITDSEIYDNSDTSTIFDNTDVTSSSGVGMLKSLLNDIKDFPRFFYEFFCFIPEQVYLAISALIVCLVPIALLKLVL